MIRTSTRPFLSKTGIMVTSTRRCIPGGTLGQVPEASSRPGRSGTDICTYDLTQELWPGAYKRVSQRSHPVPGPAVSVENKTMAARGSTLFLLGLGLCLGVLFASASSAERNDACHFTEVFTTGPGIKANSDVYKNNTVYTGEQSQALVRGVARMAALHPCSQLHKTRSGWGVGAEGERERGRRDYFCSFPV